MAATSFFDEPTNLTLTLLRLRVDVLRLRRDLMARNLRPDAKYRADQPRVPAGNADGGQWTDGSGGSGPMSFEEWLAGGWADVGTIEADRDSGEGLGDWDLPADDAEVEQVANRSRGGSGSWPDASPGQQARLVASDLQAQAAIRRVQEIDPRWKPPASMSQGIEGAILSNQAAVRHAQASRLRLIGLAGHWVVTLVGRPCQAHEMGVLSAIIRSQRR